MSWTLSASGHGADAGAERELVEGLRELLNDPAAGATSAGFFGQHEGSVNLVDRAETTADKPITSTDQ